MLGDKKNGAEIDVNSIHHYAFQLICKDATLEFVVDGYLQFKYITAGKFHSKLFSFIIFL